MKYKIKDLVDVYRGASPRPIIEYLTDKGHRWLKISDFKMYDRYVYDTKEYIKETGVKKTRFMPKGTLILTNSATPGIPIFLGNDMCLHDGFLYFQNINERIINIKFLYYWFLFNKNKIVNQANGSVFQNLKKEIVENFEIDLPVIENQIKIVELLEKINDKIELNNQINDNLQELINNLYIKYFINFDEYCGKYKESNLGMIPENFEVDTLGNVITFSNGYGWNSKDMLDNNIEDSYKVFKMGNINIGGGINKAKTKSWIKKEKAKNLEQYISKKGDILMCMTDMKNSGNPLLGHTALIDKDNEFVINQRVGIIRCNKKLGYSYIYTMSNLKHFINDIRSRANSGVQVNLTTKGICDTLILVPDDITLSKFQKVATPLYEKIFSNNNENEILEQLRDTLLPKLMNGEIDLNKIEI